VHIGGDVVHSAGRPSIAVFQVDYQDGDQLQPFTAQLNFLMLSCRPCDFRHSSSKLQVLSAHSGYIVVLFQATYSGTFNLHLQDGDNTPQSFVFDVEQHVRVDVLGPLRAMTHHDSDHLDISSEFAREACGSSSCAHGTLAASTAFDGRSRAVATMISTDSYVTGALVLLWGILNYGNVGASHLICLVTESVSASSRKRLEVAGWEIFPVSVIESNSSDIVEEKWRQQFTKLHLFSLASYTQVMYLDSDTVVKGSLDSAWRCDAPLCAAPDVFHPVFFNCGVLVLTPNTTELQLLLSALPSLPAHESEQSALNEYFLTRFQPLHITLNFQKHT
jgi:hypothetical protein